MRGMNTRLWQCSKARTRGGITILSLALSVLAGCATGGKIKPEPVAAGPPAAAVAAVAGPSVARLQDGREGFIITETPKMDAPSRDDFERAVGMLKAGDNDGAIGLLEKVIARSPGITAPYIDIAQAYERVNKLEQVEQHLKTALSLVPAHPVASNEYGLLLRRTGHFTEARAVYEKTLAAFPEYLPARRNLGILCDLYLNDQACALDQYEIYSKAMPNDAQVKIWIADLRMRMGH